MQLSARQSQHHLAGLRSRHFETGVVSPNPFIERTSQRPLRALCATLMSNVRSRARRPSMSKNFLVVVCFACLVMPLQAQQNASAPLDTKLLVVRLPAGWTAVLGETDIEVRPPESAESAQVHLVECVASSTNCLSECNDASARNYLYFFENNDPPANRRSVARSERVFEYRADGRFGDSDVWVAASVLCSKSGLVVILAQSETQSLANSYLDVVLRSVAWQK